MASTFAGVSIASRGLSASQTGLTVTTTNMSNVDTDGYSRQVVKQSSIGPAAVYSGSMVGGGTAVMSVDRVASLRLNQKYWQQNSASSMYEAASSYLEQVETVFGSTDTNSINTALDDFSSELETLATDPTSAVNRTTVLAKAEDVCSALHDASQQLQQLRNDLNSEVQTSVSKINSIAQQVAGLNKDIALAKAAGSSSNELEDKRDSLLDDLSSQVNINVTQTDDGQVNVTINGNSLVSGDAVSTLECYTVTDSSSSQYGMCGIRHDSSGQDITGITGGALGGYLSLRDGSSTDNKGILYYQNQLDTAARTFAQALNEGVTADGTSYSGSADGYGLDGSTGIRFFTYDNLSSADFVASGSDLDAAYAKITAANISVSLDVQNDTDKIAAAAATEDEGDNDNLNDIIKICESLNISGNATAADLFTLIVADVGNESAAAQLNYSRKSTLTSYINTSRQSVSGVSSDEETVNLTKYQSAYEASATVVSTWNEIYETTINMVKS